MSLTAVGLVLLAALIHASWNAMIRGSKDRVHTVAAMDALTAIIITPVLFFVPLPNAAAWFYIGLSAFIHVVYKIYLIKVYEHGELSSIYPIARGASPMLVTLGALVFAHESLSLSAWMGVLLVSTGILSLAHPKHNKGLTILLALGTSVCVACYSVTDGVGGRLSENVFSYSFWMFAIYGYGMLGVWAVQWRDRKIFDFRNPLTRHSAIGGALALAGYTVIIWAMTISPMGAVSALRETSVVFATLIGVFFLKEKMSIRRILACIIIVAGTFCLT